jgi:phosphoribosylaminoimidazole-succinocarboxamide synthase
MGFKMLVEKEELYRGKAKTLFATEDPDLLLVQFRDDATAFNGVKCESLPGKGAINNKINALIMQYLEQKGIPSHFERMVSATTSIVKRLDMIPIECVVRNVAAGNLCKRLGVELGTPLDPPTFEFFLKNDALGDPMINEYHIRSFAWAKDTEIARMKELTFRVNDILKQLFDSVSLILVDYKLEFGIYHGEILLADEFSPDGCRIWDKETKAILDKDRFRQDLGQVVEAYQEVVERLERVLAVTA